MDEISVLFADIMPAVENWLRAAVREEVANALDADREKAKPEKMYSREEVCAMLHISKPTLWAKTKSGEIPATHAGRRVLYSQSAIKNYMEG